MSSFNIAVVDDHNLFRKGLIKLIKLADTNDRYKVIFDVENGLSLQKAFRSNLMPDIVLMDIDMPEMDGYETVEWLRKNHPNVKILVISMNETEDSVVRMLRLGVKGYLSKDIEITDMSRALDSIANEGLYYSGFVSEIISNMHLKDVDGTEEPTYKKSELQFLKYICTDMTYDQIANRMHKSVKTVDGYRASFFNRFGVRSRQGLAVYVITNNIISIDDI